MKKLLLLVCLIESASPLMAQEAWTPISQEQAEYNRLMQECDRIAERFTRMGSGAQRSSAFHGAIFSFLKNIGTPVSLRVLKAQIAMGRVPAHYINNI